MGSTSASISSSDQIFATLIAGGRVVASVSRSNFASINEIVRFVCSAAGRFMGLASLSIRNKSQGWTINMSLAGRQGDSLGTRNAGGVAARYRQASLFAS